MTQIILTIIEDFIMALFIKKYLNLNTSFIFFSSIICIAETTFVQYIPNWSYSLPFVMFLTILFLIFLFKKNISLNDFIGALLGPTLILLTDILSLFILKPVFPKFISNNYYILSASFFSKILLIIAYYFILNYSLEIKKILIFKDWWMLLPIWIIVFFILYFLGESIILNKVTYNTIYIITILLLLLSIFLLILFYRIQKENELKHKNELIHQKEIYIKKNYTMMKKLYDEISKIEHSTTYSFMYIKALLLNEKYNDINSFLNEKNYESKSIQNIINTGNPYFDYELNKILKKMSNSKNNIKISVNFKNSNFEIDKNNVDNIINIIKFIFSVSNKNYSLNIDIVQKGNFIIFTLINNLASAEYKDYKYFLDSLKNTDKISCNYKQINSYIFFKILVETETIK